MSSFRWSGEELIKYHEQQFALRARRNNANAGACTRSAYLLSRKMAQTTRYKSEKYWRGRSAQLLP